MSHRTPFNLIFHRNTSPPPRRWTPHHMHVNVHLLSSLHLFTLVTSSFVVQLCIALQSFAPLSPAIRCTTTPHSEHRHAVLFMAPMALMFMHDSHPIPISYLDMRRDRARRIVLFIVALLMKSKTNLVQSHSIQISFHQFNSIGHISDVEEPSSRSPLIVTANI
jgi:hypothetical protein